MTLLSKQEYIFTGKHAEYMEILEKYHAFDSHWQIYVVAPLIGFMYKRKAEPDNSVEAMRKITLNQLIERQEQIYFNYRLIMLKDEQHEPDVKERIKKAFSIMDTDAAASDEELFNQYLLGGIEVLYEKIIKNNTDEEKVLENLGEFIEELSVGDNSLVDDLGISL